MTRIKTIKSNSSEKFNNGLSIRQLEERFEMSSSGSRDKDICICSPVPGIGIK